MSFPSTNPFALQPLSQGPDRARLESLELQLAEREADLARLKLELQMLQSRYLDEIGGFYAELTRLETAIDELEIRLGLRPPPVFDEAGAEDDAGIPTPSCTSRSGPSDDLKKVFRDLAKAIHPDLAEDEPARCRRHSLMAEANRAYAERDEDRLRLILRAWAHGPDATIDDDEDDDGAGRVQRRMAQIDRRLIGIEAELSDLRASAIWRLKGRIDEARNQGWDLFGEMILQVKREIARAQRRLASLSLQITP